MPVEGKAYNLWEVERIVANCVEDQVLQPVDHAQEILAKCRHGCCVVAMLRKVSLSFARVGAVSLGEELGRELYRPKSCSR